MNILPFSRINDACELDMQNEVESILRDREFRKDWDTYKHSIYREFHVSEIGRISDIVVYLYEKKIINIECKLENYTEVLKQANDHLLWADYSCICLHASAYLPNYIIQEMINNGIGLLLWKPGILFEILLSYKSKKIDKNYRESINKRFRKLRQLENLKKTELKLWGG